MNPKPLSQDLTDALRAAGGEPLPVIDPSNQHLYLVVDQKIHQQAMRALRHQENIEAIRRGVQSMETRQGMSLQESQRSTEDAVRQQMNQ